MILPRNVRNKRASENTFLTSFPENQEFVFSFLFQHSKNLTFQKNQEHFRSLIF